MYNAYTSIINAPIGIEIYIFDRTGGFHRKFPNPKVSLRSNYLDYTLRRLSDYNNGNFNNFRLDPIFKTKQKL